MASALFTIEQIELIRRLRNSGITKEQVSMAFDQMDRLEVELGKQPSSSSSRSNNNNNSLHYPTICSTLDHDPPATNGISKASEAAFFKDFSRPQSSSNSSTDGGVTDGTQNGELSPGTANHSPTSRLSSELTVVPLNSAAAPPVPVSYSPADGSVQAYGGRSNDGASSANCVPIQCLVNPLDLLQDECYELDELKKLVSPSFRVVPPRTRFSLGSSTFWICACKLREIG